MVQHGGPDSASVGIKLPNGTYERPIGKNRLHWVRPGINGFSQTEAWKLKLPSLMPCCGSCTIHKRAVVFVLFVFFFVIHKRDFCIYLSGSCFLSHYNET